MSRRLLQRCLVACALWGGASPVFAGGIYSQIVVPFPSERPFSYTYNKGEHALVLAFQKTSPSELTPLEQYDERLIKRVLIKDLGAAGTEVKLILRDRDVHAIVNKFAEPFRVTVDLFDADFEEERDPLTGMPLVGSGRKDGPGRAGLQLVAPGDGPVSTIGAAMPQSPIAADGSSAGASGRGEAKRHLLQPVPELFTNPDELAGTMRTTAEGVGKSWKDYPPFIYRLQTAPFEAGLARERQQVPSPTKALTSAEAMAQYAGKLYDVGHETKALVAYEQVLHRDQSIFDKDALHLWKFAEAHLGQGNLTLAHGYFEALTAKHPESPLANLARVRLIDIEAIRLLAAGRYLEWPTLVAKIDQVKVGGSGELASLLGIRRAYFAKATLGKTFDPARLPPLDAGVHSQLAAAYNHAESSRTDFLTGALLLSDLLTPAVPWQRATGAFADAYLKRFSGTATEPYRTHLKDALYAKLNNSLQIKVEAGKLLEATNDYEALPTGLRTIKQQPKTAWALAEAYRKLGQADRAVEHYAAAAKTEGEGPDRFKAEFWLAVTAGDLAEAKKKQGGSADQVSHLAAASRGADKAAAAAWQHLKPEEQAQLSVAYKDPFEKSVTDQTKLRIGPEIVLASWTKSLATGGRPAGQDAQSGGDAGDWGRAFSPSGSAVILLTDLAKRFSELGMPAERRQALDLLKNMHPKDFKGDKAANQIWANQLVGLAEDYRKTSQYLDAGRLYSQVGAESENFAGRAEALYKGGLLLYRAGRRAEAIDAFKQASDDGNNLFYANLAKERLSQLQ